jgi:hypothetical protein
MCVVLWTIVNIQGLWNSSLNYILKLSNFLNSCHALLSRIKHLASKITTCLRRNGFKLRNGIAIWLIISIYFSFSKSVGWHDIRLTSVRELLLLLKLFKLFVNHVFELSFLFIGVMDSGTYILFWLGTVVPAIKACLWKFLPLVSTPRTRLGLERLLKFFHHYSSTSKGGHYWCKQLGSDWTKGYIQVWNVKLIYVHPICHLHFWLTHFIKLLKHI